MGAAAGAAKTLGQLQYDINVREVVHRRGAAAARAFFRLDLTLMTKIARGLLDSTNLDRNATVGGRGLGLLVLGPFGVMRRRPTMYRYHIDCYLETFSALALVRLSLLLSHH